MNTPSSSSPAATFRALHTHGPMLLLPNAWDAASARLVEACGASAIATSSAAVSWVHGVPDGEHLSLEMLLATTREIVRAVRVPVSVDLEAGYGATPEAVAQVVRQVLDAGAVGINLEDGSAPPEVLMAKLEAARRTAAQAGVDLFLNARTDIYLRGLVPPEERVRETLTRARRYRDAGCDGLFVPGLTQPEEISAIARAASVPLNVMARPHLAPPATLEALGVRRLSLGTALALAALGTVRRHCVALLERGEYGGLFEDPVTYAEMNALLARE
ncbi:MAG: isocitrate lyase/PEP mutase family protein [Archangium sp.]